MGAPHSNCVLLGPIAIGTCDCGQKKQEKKAKRKRKDKKRKKKNKK